MKKYKLLSPISFDDRIGNLAPFFNSKDTKLRKLGAKFVNFLNLWFAFYNMV